MPSTAEVIQLDDARRARIQQFTVVLSRRVTVGGDTKTKGLITRANNPIAIDHIRQSLANPDFAALGHLREDVATFGGRENSLWIETGPFLVFYSICRAKNQLEIESVFLRRRTTPDPRPPKLSGLPNQLSTQNALRKIVDRRRRLLCVAAVLFLAVALPCVYFSIHRSFSGERSAFALNQYPAENSVIVFSSPSEWRHLIGILPEWIRTAVLPGSPGEFWITATNNRAIGTEIIEPLDVASNRFASRKLLFAGRNEWDSLDKRPIESVPFGNESFSAGIPTDNFGFAPSNNSFAPSVIAIGKPVSIGDWDATAQNDRPDLPQEVRYNCEKSKVKSVYLCSVIVSSPSAKTFQKGLTRHVHLGRRESGSGGLMINPTSPQVGALPQYSEGRSLVSLNGKPDLWLAERW